MRTVTITVDRPPFDHVDTMVRHMLRDLYGFVPANLAWDMADHIHAAVTAYQDGLVADLQNSGAVA
jgi:hypothetical protein